MIIQNIKNWLYSFMRDIDSEREYIVSKLLLLSYVSSTEVGAIIEPQETQRIYDFLRQYVFSHETFFARCYYIDV